MLRTSLLPVVPPQLNCAVKRSSTYAVMLLQPLLLLTVRLPVSFSFTDALRWVRRGIRLPACTIPARCSAMPASTDPDQHVTGL